MPAPEAIVSPIRSQPLNDWYAYLDSEKLGIGDLPKFNVRDYGAIGDYNPSAGTGANDTAAIQAAIDDARTLPQAKVVFDSRKRYFSDQINMTDAQNLILDGNGAALYLHYAINDALFFVKNMIRPTIRNFILTGVSDVQPLYELNPRHALAIAEYSSFPVFQNCIFRKFNTHGIVLRDLNGGTYTEGARIDTCLFLDSPYDASTPYQCGVILGDDGEYSTITNSYFFRIPSAARFTNGANGTFAYNTVMQLNGGDSTTLQTDRAGIYAEPGSNAGKIIVAYNHINHNMTAQIPVILKGDPTKPQNPYKLIGNDMLVNGNDNVGYQAVLYDAPNSVVSQNNMRPASTTVNHPVLRLNSSANVMLSENYFRGGQNAVDTDGNSTFKWSNNVSEEQTGTILSDAAKVGIRNMNNRSFVTRVTSGGTMSMADDKRWTASRSALGQFKVTHTIGSTNYIVSVEPDNESGSFETSVVRSSTDFTVYIYDDAGNAVDINFMATVTVLQSEGYVL